MRWRIWLFEWVAGQPWEIFKFRSGKQYVTSHMVLKCCWALAIFWMRNLPLYFVKQKYNLCSIPGMTDSLMIAMLLDLDRLVDREHNMGEPVITWSGYWPLIGKRDSNHVTWILASDWVKVITWPGYCWREWLRQSEQTPPTLFVSDLHRRRLIIQ